MEVHAGTRVPLTLDEYSNQSRTHAQFCMVLPTVIGTLVKTVLPRDHVSNMNPDFS